MIAPDSNRSATGRAHHAPRPALGRGGGVRRRHHRLRDRRHAGGLRALRRARPDRRSARADRVGHQPRREPGRRHHLLGHRRRGARGHRARHPGACAVVAARAGAATSSRSRAFVARMVEELDEVPMPEGTLLNVNCPAGEVRGARACRLGKRIYNDRDGADRGGRGGRRRYRIYGEQPGYEHEDGTDFAAIAEGLHRRHPAPLRPDRPGRRGGARGLRPRALLRPGHRGR